MTALTRINPLKLLGLGLCAAAVVIAPTCKDEKSESKDEAKAPADDTQRKFFSVLEDDWPIGESEGTEVWKVLMPKLKEILGGKRTFKDWRVEQTINPIGDGAHTTSDRIDL